jgi:hypothetical protein
MEHEPPGRRRARRSFLLPFATVLALATIGSSVLIVRHSQQSDDDYYYPAAAEPSSGTGYSTLNDSSAGQTLPAAIASVDTLNAARPSVAAYGVAVLDRTTGQLSLGSEAATPLYSASVVKLFTVVDILHRAEAEGLVLTAVQRADIQRALSLSDDNAMNALWNQFGGPRTVTEMVALAGLRDTRPPANPGEWGETLISARDVVGVYQYLLSSMGQSSRDTVLGALAGAQESGADGFDQAFGLLRSPRPVTVAAKQGWMIDGPQLYLHSTGVTGAADRYVIALLSAQPATVGYQTAKAYLSAAATTVVDALAH